MILKIYFWCRRLIRRLVNLSSQMRNNAGQLHKVNGPATKFINGDWGWFLFGDMHRYYGPARKWDNRNLPVNNFWFIHGKCVKWIDSTKYKHENKIGKDK